MNAVPRSAFLVMAGIIFCILFSQIALSQVQEAFPLVKKVTFEVNGQPIAEDMKDLVTVREGEPFSVKKISMSIKQIYKTGLFSDIQVIISGKENTNLTFRMTKRLFVQKVEFLTQERVPQEKIKKKLASLREGSSFSEEKLSRALQELKEALSEEGFFYPELNARIHRFLDQSQVSVLFEINSAKKYVVKEIAFTGDIIFPEEELRRKIETRKNTTFVPSVLDRDIAKLKEIYHSLDFQRIEINVKEKTFGEDKGTISLLLEIVPHERVEIEIRGAKVPLKLLKPIWDTRIFEEWGVAEGEAKIIEYLRKKDYIFSSVQSFIEKDEKRIHVVYQVSPGERYRIQEITFAGLNYFKPAQIKKELGISESIPIFGRIDGAKLYALPKEIEFFYKTHGFPHTKVGLNFEGKRRRIKAIFIIEEGKQEKIGSLSIEGAHLFSQERLLKEMSSFHGGPFFQPNIERDIEKLENLYANQGVRGTEIKAGIQKKEDSFFSVHFQVKEGQKVKIKNIVITGNQITKRRTILRELMVREGDYSFLESIRETKRRLERLGIFTEVKIEEVPLSRDQENLLISVSEGERNYASLGLGLETRSEPRIPAVWNNTIRLRGTAEFIRANIFGTAAQFSLVGQVSQSEKRAVISWEQPYFFGLPMRTYLNAWVETEERKSYSFDRRGFSLSTIKSLSEKENIVFISTLRAVSTTIFDLQISESEVDRQHSPFSATSVSGSLIWDTRDDPFNAERGYFLSSVLEWAYPLLNTKSNFLRVFFKYQHFIPLFPSVILSSTTRLGLGKGMIPIHERFFGGGSNSFRGVEFDELGPKDPNSLNPVGGKALLLFNLELSLPLSGSIPNLYGAVFYDRGNVFAERKMVSWASLQDAIGFGLRYRTPLGPIRFELGWNLDAPKEEKMPLAFISIGNVF